MEPIILDFIRLVRVFDVVRNVFCFSHSVVCERPLYLMGANACVKCLQASISRTVVAAIPPFFQSGKGHIHE